MTYKVDLYNKDSLSHIKSIEIVNEPSVRKEINGAYSFDFEAHYLAKNDLNNNVLVKVEEQYFQVAKIIKSRDDSITLSVQCEHVSYELISDEEYKEDIEMEDTAEGMIQTILSGTRFSLGTCIATSSAYYKTKTKDLRKQLFDVANLFDGELIFDNFTVHLVHQQGTDNNLDIELGVNLLGVTEEIDYRDGSTAYELNLVDLSKVAGHELDFSSAELGDTIGIKDNILGIDTRERIIAIQYNPFKKALPTVTVGDYIRDFTKYLKEEDEEDEEEIDPTANYYLSKFNIGSQDCLKVMGVEIDNDLALPEGISASLEYSSNNQYTGVFIQLKSQYSSYFITVYKVLKDGKFDTFDYSTQSASINTWLLPTEDIVGVGVIVTKTPFTTFDATKDDFRQYGVNFTRLILDPFREFKIGIVNCLTLTDLALDTTATLPEDIKAEIPYEELNELTGLFLSLKKEFASWHIQIQTFNKAGAATTHNFSDIKDTVKTWTLPNDNIMAIVVTVMEKSPAEFMEGTHLKQVYGVKFTQIEVPPDYWLSELKFGEIDCLVDGLDVTELTLNNPPFGDVPPPAPLPGGADLNVEGTIKNITLTLKDEYVDYYQYLYFFNDKGDVFSPSFDGEINESDTGMGIFPLEGTWYLKIFIIENIDNYRMYQVKVNVTPETVDGLITIKHKDEIGNVISIREQAVTAAGIYEITADEIDGYEFIPIIVDPTMSPYIRKVEITKENPNATVEFTYRPTSTQPKKGYVMEFGIAQLASTLYFEFENTEGYDEVKSIVHSVDGHYSGEIKVNFTPVVENGKNVAISAIVNHSETILPNLTLNIHAVCFNEVN